MLDTVIFETLKDSSLEINNLALNNCFSYKECLPKLRQRVVKNGFKNPVFFCQKDHMLVKFEQNRMGITNKILSFLNKKNG